MFYATIIRDRFGRIHVRVSERSGDAGGDVEVIDVLQGEDRQELKARATRFVSNHLQGGQTT